MEEENERIMNEEDLRHKVDSDIAYIKNDVIAKQIDGNYCKWSRKLKAVAIIGQTAKGYCKYWENQYKKYPQYAPEITKACVDKLVDGLTPPEVMIEMIRNSHDMECEKVKAIKMLGGRYKNDTPPIYKREESNGETD